MIGSFFRAGLTTFNPVIAWKIKIDWKGYIINPPALRDRHSCAGWTCMLKIQQGALAGETKRRVFQIPREMQHGLRLRFPTLVIKYT